MSFQVMNPWLGCRLYDYMYFFRHFLVSSADQGVDIKLMTRDYDIWHISEFMPILDFLMNSERHPSSSQVWPFWLHYVHCCNNFWLDRVCTVDGRAISSGGESLKLSNEYLDCQPGVPGFSKDHRCRNSEKWLDFLKHQTFRKGVNMENHPKHTCAPQKKLVNGLDNLDIELAWHFRKPRDFYQWQGGSAGVGDGSPTRMCGLVLPVKSPWPFWLLHELSGFHGFHRTFLKQPFLPPASNGAFWCCFGGPIKKCPICSNLSRGFLPINWYRYQRSNEKSAPWLFRVYIRIYIYI